VIEQVGPPTELYHRPATKFVAGFIGSPAMNFIPAQLANGGAAMNIHLPDGIVLPVPEDRKQRYAPYVGKEVLFGLRPEHITDARPNDHRPNFAPLKLTPEVVEPMGMETLIYVWMQGTEISARIDPAVPAEPGRPLPLAADMSQMHLIDPQTDRVI
jgi:multiple sugar transport system ATP-binding protein